jgi:diamine N-acetyltransferase
LEIIIRKGKIEDANLLSELATESFYQTYSSFNTAENMRSHVGVYFNKTQMKKELNEENNPVFIAFANEQIAGYIRLRTTENVEELKNKKNIEIERIYVLQKFQQLKIGWKLISKAIEIAKQKGFEILWLGVWKQNEKAINFYKKVGFQIFGEHPFMLGNDAQTDFLMKLKLV